MLLLFFDPGESCFVLSIVGPTAVATACLVIMAGTIFDNSLGSGTVSTDSGAALLSCGGALLTVWACGVYRGL